MQFFFKFVFIKFMQWKLVYIIYFRKADMQFFFVKFVLSICGVFYAVKIYFENLFPKSMNADVFNFVCLI